MFTVRPLLRRGHGRQSPRSGRTRHDDRDQIVWRPPVRLRVLRRLRADLPGRRHHQPALDVRIPSLDAETRRYGLFILWRRLPDHGPNQGPGTDRSQQLPGCRPEQRRPLRPRVFWIPRHEPSQPDHPTLDQTERFAGRSHLGRGLGICGRTDQTDQAGAWRPSLRRTDFRPLHQRRALSIPEIHARHDRNEQSRQQRPVWSYQRSPGPAAGPRHTSLDRHLRRHRASRRTSIGRHQHHGSQPDHRPSSQRSCQETRRDSVDHRGAPAGGRHDQQHY